MSLSETTDGLWILTGAPGTGKTAIIDELRGDVRCVDEPARRVLAGLRATGDVGTPQQDPGRFVELLLELPIADHDAARGADGPTLFDRGIPDCIAYATYLGVDPGPSLAASERHRYHADVFVLESWKEIYSTDDERTMSFEQVLAFHGELEDAYRRAGYRSIVVPSASVADRPPS